MNKFWETQSDIFEFDKAKSDLIHNLDFIADMTVEEQTLYKKWVEWNSDLYSSMSKLPVLQSYYDNIWAPTDINDLELTIKELKELEPYIEIAEDTTKWIDIRRLTSTMEFTANPGRNIKVYVKAKSNNKILGMISLGSDITALGVRDKYIGWTKEDKFKNGKLNHTAIGTSIIPTQPLGYNFLGGKLIAALTTAPEIRQEWETKYGNKLVGLGTTSLYGSFSQYNGVPHFKKLGDSAGKINIKPDDKFYDPWHQWLKENRADWYNEAILEERKRNGVNMGYDKNGPVSGIKQKIITKIFRELGISITQYYHGFQRGVYYANIYENGNEFLCSKIEEKDLIIKPKFDKGIEYTMDWWRDKAINRYKTLHAEGRIKPESLYYIDIIGIPWEECKAKYINDIGR